MFRGDKLEDAVMYCQSILYWANNYSEHNLLAQEEIKKNAKQLQAILGEAQAQIELDTVPTTEITIEVPTYLLDELKVIQEALEKLDLDEELRQQA